MNNLLIGGIGTIVLIGLMMLGMPVAFGLCLVGFFGMWYAIGIHGTLVTIGQLPYTTAASYTMSVIPLFVLMGNLAYESGITGDLFKTANIWLGRWRGGLAVAVIAACAGFSAICGSNVATAATIGSAALPEMRKRKYDTALACGCIASGGTLGILVPPSIAMVVYAMLTTESVGQILVAGFIPGLFLSLLFIINIIVWVIIKPQAAPQGEKSTWQEKFSSLKGVWPTLTTFLIVIGGIYFGIFTSNEAAGIGVFVIFIISLIYRTATRRNIFSALIATGKTTGMILMILIGATILSYFMTVIDVPQSLSAWISGLQISRYAILVVICTIYIILGTVMNGFTIMVLTLPIIYPIVTSLGFDGVWFAIITIVTCEIADITPPLGLTVFVVGGLDKTIPMSTVFRGALPFSISLVLSLIIFSAFPKIVTILPEMMSR